MKLRVKIITPSSVFCDLKEFDNITLQTNDGEITVLPKHAPIVSTLRIGTVTLRNGSDKTFIHVHRGIVEVKGEEVKIITERLYLIDENGSKIETPKNI